MGLKQLLFCYENSLPDSAARKEYETRLRHFVASHTTSEFARFKAEQARDYSRTVNATDAPSRQIDEYFSKYSK
jgi:hypothetical protein